MTRRSARVLSRKKVIVSGNGNFLGSLPIILGAKAQQSLSVDILVTVFYMARNMTRTIDLLCVQEDVGFPDLFRVDVDLTNISIMGLVPCKERIMPDLRQ